MFFTTSRKAGLKTRAFARDITKSFPHSHFFSRGKSSLDIVLEHARFEGHSFLCIVKENHGNPSELHFLSVMKNDWKPFVTCSITVAKLRKELSKSRKAFPSIHLQLSSLPIKKVFKELHFDSTSDADLVVKERENMLRFYAEEKELGPRFSITRIHYETEL
jgi:rRNA maturation protein Rpf1